VKKPPFGATIVVVRGQAAATEALLLHRAHNGPEYAGDWAWTPPAGERFASQHEYTRRQRIPLFLLLAATRLDAAA